MLGHVSSSQKIPRWAAISAIGPKLIFVVWSKFGNCLRFFFFIWVGHGRSALYVKCIRSVILILTQSPVRQNAGLPLTMSVLRSYQTMRGSVTI